MMTTFSEQGYAGVNPASSSAVASSTPTATAASSGPAEAVDRVSSNRFRGKYYGQCNRELLSSLKTSRPIRNKIPPSAIKNERIARWSQKHTTVAVALTGDCIVISHLIIHLQEWMKIFDQLLLPKTGQPYRPDPNIEAEVYKGSKKFFDLLKEVPSYMREQVRSSVNPNCIVDMLETLFQLSENDIFRLNTVINGCVSLLSFSGYEEHLHEIKLFAAFLSKILSGESLTDESIKEVEVYKETAKDLLVLVQELPLVHRLFNLGLRCLKKAECRLLEAKASQIAHQCAIKGSELICQKLEQTLLPTLESLKSLMQQEVLCSFDEWQKALKDCVEAVKMFRNSEPKICEWLLSLFQLLEELVQWDFTSADACRRSRLRINTFNQEKTWEIAKLRFSWNDKSAWYQEWIKIFEIGSWFQSQMLQLIEREISQHALSELMDPENTRCSEQISENLKNWLFNISSVMQKVDQFEQGEEQRKKIKEEINSLIKGKVIFNNNERSLKGRGISCLVELKKIISKQKFFVRIRKLRAQSVSDLDDLD